jgi:ligand-binding SRPBCC domain-containing protein
MRDFRTDPITASAVIHAPIERVFALSTRVELVKETLGMNLVDSGVENGVAAGHIRAHSRVVWHGWKFGLPTSHHTLITGFADPERQPTGETTAWFQDSQERGRFAFFQHDHHFRQTYSVGAQDPTTELYDEVRFTLPFGPLGALAAKFLLAPHIQALCKQRFARIKSLAEGEGWREWVSE